MPPRVLGRRAVMAGAILGAIGLTACDRPVYTVNNVAFGGTGTLQQRTAQILEAAQALEWQARPTGPGRIRMTYTWTEHRIVLDAVFDENAFSLFYAGSVGLRYDSTNVHRAYNRRVRELERQIQVRALS